MDFNTNQHDNGHQKSDVNILHKVLQSYIERLTTIRVQLRLTELVNSFNFQVGNGFDYNYFNKDNPHKDLT